MILFHPTCHRVNAALATRTFLEQLVTTVAATAITDNQPILPIFPAPNIFWNRLYFPRKRVLSIQIFGASVPTSVAKATRGGTKAAEAARRKRPQSCHRVRSGSSSPECCTKTTHSRPTNTCVTGQVLSCLGLPAPKDWQFQASFLELPDDVTTTVELSVLFVETTIRHGSYRAIWATFIC